MDLRWASSIPLLVVAPLCAQPQPVYHWTLDESQGTVAHELFGGTAGVLQGGAQWAPGAGHHQGACRFDGVDDRIILGPCDITTGNGGFGVSIWVRPDFVTAMDRTLVAKTVGPAVQDHIWSLTFVNASALRFRLRTGPTTTTLSTPPSSIFSGVWYHVVGTFDGTAMRIYLNGALMAETLASGNMGFHPQAPASVAALSTGAAPFSGWVDDLRLFDQGLTQQDVIDILLEAELTTTTPEFGANHEPGIFASATDHHRPTRLLDATGRCIRGSIPDGTPASEILSGLPPGVYMLHTVNGAGPSTRRIALR